MTTPDRTWHTARLTAMPPRAADAPVLFEQYASDLAVARYMTWTPHRRVEDTREYLSARERAWADRSAFLWTLWLADGAFAGVIEARVRTTGVDIGYALARRHWRQGLMTEAAGALVRWALAQPDIFRVWATCDVENVASARLLERVGMQREGVLRRWLIHPNVSPRPRDCFCYSVVKPA